MVGRSLHRALILLSVLGPLACVSLTPNGQVVRITTNPDVVRGCEFRGNVRGYSTSWGLVGNPKGEPNGLDQENAETDLRNQAGARGGNVVYLNSRSSYSMLGEAYLCDSLPLPPSQSELRERVAFADRLSDELAATNPGVSCWAAGPSLRILVLQIAQPGGDDLVRLLLPAVNKGGVLTSRGFSRLILVDSAGKHFEAAF